MMCISFTSNASILYHCKATGPTTPYMSRSRSIC